jgi:hypothetical protein
MFLLFRREKHEENHREENRERKMVGEILASASSSSLTTNIFLKRGRLMFYDKSGNEIIVFETYRFTYGLCKFLRISVIA